MMLRASILLLTLLLASCLSLSRLSVKEQIAYGDAAMQVGQYQQARKAWQQALSAVQQEQKSIQLQLKLARVEEILGNFEQAMHYAQNVVSAQNNPLLQARAQSFLAILFRRVGDSEESQRRSEAALKLTQDQAIQSESMRNLGTLARERGDFVKARDYLEQAKKLAIAADNQQRLAESLNELGSWYYTQAKYAQALQHYQQSYALFKSLNAIADQTRLLGNQCNVYSKLNQYQKALGYCQQALHLARRHDDQPRMANQLNNLAGLYQAMKKTRKATQTLQESIAIKHALNDKGGLARGLSNLGDLYRQQGNDAKAHEFYQQSLALKRSIGDRPGISATQYRLGVLALERGQPKKAQQHFETGLRTLTTDQRDLLWRILAGLQISYAETTPALAIFYGKQAVAAIQSVRADIQNLTQSEQRTYLQNKLNVYRQLAGLLIEQGRLSEATQVLDLLKEEEYSDDIQRNLRLEAVAESIFHTVAETEWERRYRELSKNLQQLGQEYDRLNDQFDLSVEQEQRLEQLIAEIDAADAAWQEFMAALEEHFLSQTGSNHSLAKIDGLEALQDKMAVFPGRPVLVYYFPAEDKLHILLVKPDRYILPEHKIAPIKRKDLHQLIYDFRAKLVNRSEDYLQDAQTLYQVMLAPIQPMLAEFGADTLMIYGDGALRYVPVAALHDPKTGQFVAQHYALAMYTAAAREHLGKPPGVADWRVAAFGVAKSLHDEFADLPAVRDELDAIVQEETVPPGTTPDTRGILPGLSYLDEHFTQNQLVKSLRQGRVSVLHIATHFAFAPGDLDSSLLLLGAGKTLSLGTIFNRRFKLNKVELLTFSACETGLDTQTEQGREIEGLATKAQQKGAHAVLATLWKVADQSTADFMAQFYTELATSETTKAQALQQAQGLFINSGSGVATYAHPYYWAPFVLMGNWL